MSPVRVTFARTVGMARNYYATALSIGAFLAGAAISFCFNLEAGEGGLLSAGEIWAASLSPLLPMLAAVLAMDVWSDERLSGRIDMLLSSPVGESDLVLGKYLGVLALMFFAIVVSWLSVAIAGGCCGLAAGFPFLGMVALLMQSALWSAVGVMMSARFRHAAAAAMASFAAMVIVPRALWFAVETWLPEGREAYAIMPLDAHVLDLASGVLAPGTIFAYFALAFLAIFAANRYVAMLRLAGYGSRMLRRSARFSLALAFLVGALAVALAVRMDLKFELPGSAAHGFSARTRSILAGAEGELECSVFMARKDRRFRNAAQTMRAFKREADGLGGIRLSLRFVDPRWDLGQAERLVRTGAAENSVVLRIGRRLVSVPVENGLGEREVASAILRLTAAAKNRNVYWTAGHGEASFADYSPWGMSDIARELARDGFRNLELRTASAVEAVPSDCALVLVAGAKTDFSRAEIAQLEQYLNGGGRLLVLTGETGDSGANALLPRWGLKPETAPAFADARTLSGSDLLVDAFGDHPISSPLEGAQIVFDHPVAIEPSAAVSAGTGADTVAYAPLASCQGKALAAIGERGTGVGSDLMLRPTRVAAIGDVMFVMNGQLAARQNANRDFFLNTVAYLAGVDAAVRSGSDGGVLVLPRDRTARIKLMAILAGAVPLAIFLLMILNAVRRRHRT